MWTFLRAVLRLFGIHPLSAVGQFVEMRCPSGIHDPGPALAQRDSEERARVLAKMNALIGADHGTD